MKSRPFFAALMILVLALKPIAFGEEEIQHDPPPTLVEVTQSENKYYTDIIAANITNGDVTLVLSATMSNMSSSEPLPLTKTIPPHKRVSLVRLRVKDKRARWKYQYQYKSAYGAIDTKHDDTVVYQLPFEKDKKYKVIQSFGGKFSHQGELYYSIDFKMPEGSPVCCARDGLVVGTKSSSDKGGPDKEYRDDGNFIYIRHTDGSIGGYIHFQKDGVLVKPGEIVRRGQVIGLSGNTGWSTGPHLHFAVYKLIGADIGETFHIRFETKSGIVEFPEKGRYYSAK